MAHYNRGLAYEKTGQKAKADEDFADEKLGYKGGKAMDDEKVQGQNGGAMDKKKLPEQNGNTTDREKPGPQKM